MLPLREAKARAVAQERGSAEGKPTTFRQGEGSSGVSRSSALIHPIAEKSSSRKPVFYWALASTTMQDLFLNQKLIGL